jgi:hypothetical protein
VGIEVAALRKFVIVIAVKLICLADLAASLGRSPLFQRLKVHALPCQEYGDI